MEGGMAATTVRKARTSDTPFLWEMLYEASFPLDDPKPPRETLQEPQIKRYLSGWGRSGDVALVAEYRERPVGAAWYRLFPRSEPGYGFVDENTPELSIAVVPEARARGIGRLLLDRLLQAARADGFSALSWSVGSANRPARSLYERCGFEVVATDDAGDGVTMRVALR